MYTQKTSFANPSKNEQHQNEKKKKRNQKKKKKRRHRLDSCEQVIVPRPERALNIST